MILLNEIEMSGNYLVIYPDHTDVSKFYYMPNFAELSKNSNNEYIFNQQLFKLSSNPADGFSLYNFNIHASLNKLDFDDALAQLKLKHGNNISLSPIAAYDLTIIPLSNVPSQYLISRSVQTNGQNIFTDLGISMTFNELLEPEMANMFKSNQGFQGYIQYVLDGATTPFEAKITANWHRILEHFRTQVTVSYWIFSANFSYEVQRLIENDTIKIEILGGTPTQRDLIYNMAKEIAARLFVPVLQPNPLPANPSGNVINLGINYSKIEEDKSSVYQIKINDIEKRTLSLGLRMSGIPNKYFHGNPKILDYHDAKLFVSKKIQQLTI